MSKILERVARYEHGNDREALSALVVDIKKGVPGKGFYNLCQQLEIRQQEEAKYPMLKDDKRFSVAMIYKCRKFWQNDDNYKAHYSLPESDKDESAVAS